MTTKFGMPVTPKRAAIWGWLSVSTFSTTARPLMLAAVFATSGAAMRQGPHHAAQKSTSTGTVALAVTSSKSAASASMGSLTGGSAAWHDPQRPVSATRSGGTRFLTPHDGQGRITSEPRAEVEHPVPALVVAIQRPHVVDFHDGVPEEIDPGPGPHAGDEALGLQIAVDEVEHFGNLPRAPRDSGVGKGDELDGHRTVQIPPAAADGTEGGKAQLGVPHQEARPQELVEHRTPLGIVPALRGAE